jgi:putative membrane protein
MTFMWSKKPFVLGLLYTAAICALDIQLGKTISIPWQPISVIGIAVAFYLGFKNNSSYDRTWEARKIWGAIVNHSRSISAAFVSFVQGDDADGLHRELIYRHIAWMTALRHQLRLRREWEHVDERLKERYVPTVCEDYHAKLHGDLTTFLHADELAHHHDAANMATQILKDQSVRLQELKDLGHFDDFRHMELQRLVALLYDDQGKAERIKNFPFPRQYASTALWLTVVFCVLLPFGMIDIFGGVDGPLIWLCPPLTALVIWIFFLMEKIGDYSENPFEGTYNDVPITSIARGIEIDLRQMIDDENIPSPIQAENGFLL